MNLKYSQNECIFSFWICVIGSLKLEKEYNVSRETLEKLTGPSIYVSSVCSNLNKRLAYLSAILSNVSMETL